MKITSYPCDAPAVYLPQRDSQPLQHRMQRRASRLSRIISFLFGLFLALLAIALVRLLRSTKARLWTVLFARLGTEHVLMLCVGVYAGMGRRERGKSRVKKRAVLGLMGVAAFKYICL